MKIRLLFAGFLITGIAHGQLINSGRAVRSTTGRHGENPGPGTVHNLTGIDITKASHYRGHVASFTENTDNSDPCFEMFLSRENLGGTIYYGANIAYARDAYAFGRLDLGCYTGSGTYATVDASITTARSGNAASINAYASGIDTYKNSIKDRFLAGRNGNDQWNTGGVADYNYATGITHDQWISHPSTMEMEGYVNNTNFPNGHGTEAQAYAILDPLVPAVISAGGFYRNFGHVQWYIGNQMRDYFTWLNQKIGSADVYRGSYNSIVEYYWVREAIDAVAGGPNGLVTINYSKKYATAPYERIRTHAWVRVDVTGTDYVGKNITTSHGGKIRSMGSNVYIISIPLDFTGAGPFTTQFTISETPTANYINLNRPNIIRAGNTITSDQPVRLTLFSKLKADLEIECVVEERKPTLSTSHVLAEVFNFSTRDYYLAYINEEGISGVLEITNDIGNIAITTLMSQYKGTAFTVTAVSDGTVTSWKWRVLHNYTHTSGRADTLLHATSTLQNPTFTIDSLGFYDIQLIARNSSDKLVVYESRKFVVLPPRFTEGEADFVINMSSGSQFFDRRGFDMSDKKVYLKGQTTNGHFECVDCHGTPGHPMIIQKANDNVQVTIQFSGGSGKPLYFSQYSYDGNGDPVPGQSTDQGARYVIVNGFNLDGTPGIKVTAGASSTVTMRVEGKVTDFGVYGVQIVSNPATIQGAAIGIVPTVSTACNIAHGINNIHVYACLIHAGEEGIYVNESSQSSAYEANNGFNPPSGIGLVIARNTITAAGRDGIQAGSVGGAIEDNNIQNYGQQGDAAHQAGIVANDGFFGTIRRNYVRGGQMTINIKSGEYPWAPMAGHTSPQPLIVESNVLTSGTYTENGFDEPFSIYLQNNPTSGAGNWTVSIRNNTMDVDNKACEFLLALGGFTSQNFTFANNVIIKSGNAGDSQALNFTGNGKASLQGGTKTENNIVFNQGDDVSALEFTDRASGDYEPLTTDSSVYDGSPSSLTAGYDFFGFPIPLPGTVYFFGAYSIYNKRTVAP